MTTEPRTAPDGGGHTGAVALWDESTRPSVPREPGRELSAREQQSGQHLVDVHDHLRAELVQIQDLVEQVTTGGADATAARSAIAELTVRQNKWTTGAYCQSYCRVVTMHHSIEDQSMFPQLRAADPRLAPVIDRLAAEHLVIHEVLEQLDRALVAFVSGPGAAATLRTAVGRLSDTLLSHLSYEERELVEPLGRLGLF